MAKGVPQLSRQQRLVLDSERVTHIGWDEADRPVVRGMFGIPAQERTWAVKRDGDPADIKGAIRPLI